LALSAPVGQTFVQARQRVQPAVSTRARPKGASFGIGTAGGAAGPAASRKARSALNATSRGSPSGRKEAGAQPARSASAGARASAKENGSSVSIAAARGGRAGSAARPSPDKAASK
jgi:hypothetical protein